MKFLTPFAIAAAVLAQPLAAECFDSGVLSRGLTILYDNGDSTTIRRTSGGYQQVDETYVNGDPTFRFRAHRGIYFVEEFEPDEFGRPVPGTGLIVEFPMDPASLPEPAAGATWQGQNMNIFDDGTRRPEQMSITFTQGAPLQLSGCTYETLDARVLYDWADEGNLQLHYAYLPEIGTAVLVSSQFDGEDAYFFTPVGLETIRK